MLIRFSVENFKSFNDRQIFSMAAGRHKRMKSHIIKNNNYRILKSGIIFGANASGKSNFIKAISFSKKVILKGMKPELNCHFRITKDNFYKPGVFQFDILSNEAIYNYGIAVSYEKGKIESEWLYRIESENKETCVFDRDEQGKIVTDLMFSKNNFERFKIYGEDVIDSKTFLTQITESKLINNKEFSDFYNVREWFYKLIVIFPNSHYSNYSDYFAKDKKNSMIQLLRYFDTGIKKIEGKEKSIEEVLEFIPERIRDEIISSIYKTLSNNSLDKEIELSIAKRRIQFSLNEDNDLKAKVLLMNHGNNDDLFELEDESDGTKRLFDLIPLLNKGKDNFIIFVDELDRSFHTMLTKKFIETFYKNTEGDYSQLIFTTHDTNVMDLELLRQDEIWFVDRNKDQSSYIYSLNKFKERFDKVVAKEYLLGRYGAIPSFVNQWED